MKNNKNLKEKIFAILSGIIIGITNGFFGGGGGMLCVPLLEKVNKTDNKKAHSTALLVMLPLSIMSSFIYAFSVPIDWFMVSFVTIGFVCGGALGAVLLKNMSGKLVRIIFAVIVLASGIRMVLP